MISTGEDLIVCAIMFYVWIGSARRVRTRPRWWVVSALTALSFSASLGGCGSGEDDGSPSEANTPGEPECVEGMICGSNRLCFDGQCRSVCRGDSDCGGSANRCNPQTALCVECYSDEQCAPHEFCGESRCQPDVCEPGALSCDPMKKDRRVCLASGGGYDETSCPSRTTCVVADASLSCQSWVCTPGMVACDANFAVLTACSADGLVQTVTDCTAQGQRCVSGACVDTVCKPNEELCDGLTVLRCNGTGTVLTRMHTCDDHRFYCGRGQCQPDRCTAGKAICEGNVATTCLPDGSGPEPGGRDCSTEGAICDGGQCLAPLCEPGERFCDRATNSIQTCRSTGATSNVDRMCLDHEHCDSASVSCVPDVCPDGAAACDGETLATCDADGGGLSASSTDCAANGQVCSFEGGCVDVDVTTVGAFESQYTETSGHLARNWFHVTKPRTLVEIEQYGGASEGAELTWFVYEGEPDTNELTLIFETTNDGATDQAPEFFISSGPLSVPLRANKIYAFGVRVMNGGLSFAQGKQAGPFPVSFGNWVGRANSWAMEALPTTITNNGAWNEPFYQRISTGPASP